ncbi:Nn.00g109030.m01.CDS01 [Neocucurbitaria sp. VM-36]
MSYSSSNSSRTSLSSTDEKISMMLLPPTDLLVRDFGWPSTSARYRGDHTPDSNPDWEHDPLDSAEAKEEAFKKMEKSYAIYMGNLEGARAVPKKEKKPVWARFLPWVR